MIRAFLAVPPDEALRSRLEEVSRELRERFRGRDVRWTRPEKYHFTLVFLGDVDIDRVPRIRERVADVVASLTPFDYQVKLVCFFPDSRRPRVIAALPDKQQAFEAWYRPLVSVLAEEGFEPERRRFNAHITLARLRGRPRHGDLHELIEDASGRADSLVMYQSLEGEYVPLFVLDCVAAPGPGRSA